jgi:Protein of unknown function, DUF488
VSTQSRNLQRLILLKGNAEEAGKPSQASLRLLTHSWARSVQLALPIGHDRASVLISAGLHPWSDEASIEATLRVSKVRTIFDIRLSPSFGGTIIERSRWLGIVKKLEIQYLHLPELANTFVDESVERSRSMYLQYVHRQVDVLDRVLSTLEHGSVAILGFGSEQSDEDRATLIEALVTRGCISSIAILDL